MRIHPTQVYRQVQQTTLNRPSKTETAAAPSAQGGQDALTLSEEAQVLTEAMQRAQDAPDVREDRVTALKYQLEQGTYRVDSRRVAESLLRHAGLYIE